MFEKIGFIENDPNKKNILITVSQMKTREYTYGYVYPLVEVLKEKFNVYYFYEGGLKHIEECGFKNVYRLNKAKYDDFKSANLKRKKELETSDIYNQNLIDLEIAKFFKDEPQFSDILIVDNHNLMLPFNPLTSHPKLKELFNDYFDSFDDEDPGVLEEIERVNNKLFNPTAKGLSPLAFRYMYKNIMLSVIEYISKSNDAIIHPLIMDPSAAIPFFKFKGLKHRFWYFTDDHRHLRELYGFPIAELQHLVFEPHWQNITPTKKNLLEEFEVKEEKIPFFFAGSLLNDKGKRKYIWRDFFKDFSYPGAKLYFKVSLILGMDKESFENLKSDVMKHPNFCGDFMPNEEYMRVLKRCKTAFIARNVSANGGFTYRHMQYLYFGVLPLFDNLYDPAYLWIPKEFQDKLTAKNPEELQKLIEFYDNNESERLKVLKDLKKHFQVDDWVDNWKEKLVNTELFKDYLWK
jgi:hypothetical protein